MKILIDRDICISAADCIAVAPNTFDLDTEGKAVLKDGTTRDELAVILEAAKACPVACIYVYDDQGNQLWPEHGAPTKKAVQESEESSSP